MFTQSSPNQHQHISIHAYTIKSSSIACKKIHQQHICIYTYIIHQHRHHNNLASIIMIINKHHHNQNEKHNHEYYRHPYTHNHSHPQVQEKANFTIIEATQPSHVKHDQSEGVKNTRRGG